MRKNIIITLLLLLSHTACFAAVRSIEQARAAAVRLLSAHAAQKAPGRHATTRLRLAHTQMKSGSETEAAYYVFTGAAAAHGLAIISGDDRLPEIVGYTDDGTYNPDSLPDAMREYLLQYSDFASHVTDKTAARIMAMRANTATRAAVQPLIQTHWAQGSPYNDLCPEYGPGRHSVTGCVATAMAQILKYYNYPAQLKADIPAYTTYDNNFAMPAIPAGEQ